MRFIFIVFLSFGVFHAVFSNGCVKFFEKWFSEFYEDEDEARLASSSFSEFDLCDIFSALVELDFDDYSEEYDDSLDEIKPPVITGPSWLGAATPPELEGPVNFPGSPVEVDQQEKPSPSVENEGQRPTFPPQYQQPGIPPFNYVQSIPNVPPPADAAPIIIPPPNSNVSLILATFADEVDDTDGPGVIDGDEELVSG